MKTYARIARRRLEAALHSRTTTRNPVVPVMDEPVELPSEIVDLATGPFEHRFPDLAEKRTRDE